MRIAASLLLAGLSLAASSCLPGSDCSDPVSPRRTVVATGSVTIAGVTALACGENHGTVVSCEGAECCRWPVSSWGADGACAVREVSDLRLASEDLPTFVTLACPLGRVSFPLPDLRRIEPGPSTRTIPVAAGDATSAADEGAAHVRINGLDCCVGQELALALDVVEKTGEARSEGDRLASDDFHVRLRVDGSVSAPEGGPAPMSLELEVVQTAEDYPGDVQYCA